MTTLEYDANAQAFVVECWLTDLTHSPQLLQGLPGTDLPNHPASPEILGCIMVPKQEVDPSSGLVSLPDFSHPAAPIREIRRRGLDYVVVDEG